MYFPPCYSGGIALLQFDQLNGLWHGVVRGCGVVAHLGRGEGNAGEGDEGEGDEGEGAEGHCGSVELGGRVSVVMKSVCQECVTARTQNRNPLISLSIRWDAVFPYRASGLR
jgi:hypothetical protein